MKILYIVPFVPWPVKVRSFNLIPRLARNHDIHLVCVSSTEPSAEQAHWLDQYCQSVVHVTHPTWRGAVQCVRALPTPTPLRMAYCRSQAARAVVKMRYEEVRPDLVYVERWRALEFLPEMLHAPLVCDPTDSMTLYNERLSKTGTWWEKLLGWEEYWKFSRCEGEWAKRADATVFCSQLDLDCVKKQAPEARYELVPNGVDCRSYFFKDECEEEPGTIVFTGSFKYRPNCHAVKFFMNEIFPLICAEAPHAKFFAVGNGAEKALAQYRGEAGFEAVDFVPDLRPYLAKSQVAVAPMTVGSGVSNKLAEGFAVGTPVVATRLACGDLPVKSGEHLLIAWDAKEFASHVLNLFRDAALRRKIASSARRLVEENYDWEIVSKQMETLMGSLVDCGKGKDSARACASV